jgi:hypothetical protein
VATGAVVGGGGGGAAVLDVAGAGVAERAIVLRGFAFTFALVAVAVAVGAGALATTGEPAADAGAEALTIAEVLLGGVAFPPPPASPMMARTAMPATAMPTF